MGPREWGKELLLVECPHYTLKKITMKGGSRGGLQYHHKKDEAGVLLEGKLLVESDAGGGYLVKKEVDAGEAFRFPQGAVHRVTALEHSVYIEASTPYENDRYHVEADYGLPAETGGLPSTKPEDVRRMGGQIVEAVGKAKRNKKLWAKV